MKIMRTSEVRQNLQEVLDSVYYKGESVIITKSHKPRVIISVLPTDNVKINEAIKMHLATKKKRKKVRV